jgi:hypothetical protein
LQNLGPADAESVTVSNLLPTGFSLVSAVPTPLTNGQSLLFDLGTVTNGDVVNISIQVAVTDFGWWTNKATAYSATLDSVLTNNTTSVRLGAFPAGAGTWTKTSAPVTNWQSVACSADGSKIVALCGSGGNSGPIFVSKDWGETWLLTSAPKEFWRAIASSTDGNNLIAAAFDGGIYLSTNSAETWFPANSPGGQWLSVACSADGSKAILAGYSGLPYVSSDYGMNWNMTNPDIPGYWTSVACSADGTNLIIAGGPGRDQIYTSTDFATTWITNAPNLTWTSVASSADGIKLVAADGATPNKTLIYTSHDAALTWSSNGIPLASSGLLASSSDGRKLFAVLRGLFAPIYCSTDSGDTWTPTVSPVTGWNSLACSADGSTVVATDFQNVYVSRLPRLVIQSVADTAIVSWPATAIGFTIEASPEPYGTNWAAITNSPPMLTPDLLYQITITPSDNRTFYRLRSP